MTIKTDVTIPEWAQFLAQDEDGSWFAYEEKPFCIGMVKGDGIFDVKDGRFKQLSGGSSQKIDWSSTLCGREDVSIFMTTMELKI